MGFGSVFGGDVGMGIVAVKTMRERVEELPVVDIIIVPCYDS